MSSNPILNQIGTTFIPVRDIEKARDWYCDLLNLPADGDILFDHLYILPMNGTGIVLDSKRYSEETIYQTPPFHFNTHDIGQAFRFMTEKKIELTSDVEHGHWFTFKDPDGNHLMICKC